MSYIRGRVAETGPGRVVLDVGGLGFALEVPLSTVDLLPGTGEEVRLYTFLQVREDRIVLYGFGTREEQRLFLDLISINGVGPKVAMNILSAMSVEAFKVAVGREDAASLTRISGVGPKTAKRIILELKEKLSRGTKEEVQPAGAGLPSGAGAEKDAIQALVALGYTYAEAGRAIELVAAGASGELSAQDLVKSALRVLGRA
ncbi:MAG TPA: Holliday junction branch migration protein RuvA [Firmicutes bacterium]|nr:Holliday junction branch migration protein RuvA [Bacillota bacterium]